MHVVFSFSHLVSEEEEIAKCSGSIRVHCTLTSRVRQRFLVSLEMVARQRVCIGVVSAHELISCPSRHCVTRDARLSVPSTFSGPPEARTMDAQKEQ